MTPKSDARLGLFVSHSHNNRELALKIRDKVQILGNNSIDIHVSEEISGGVEWREWISAGLRQSKILVFLYTDESLNWAWPFYELGVFVGVGLGKHVCLLNTDISAPPGPLSEWQVYKADEPGVRKFLTELLAEGLLTDGVVINPDLSREHYRAELDQAVNEISTLFARARVKQVYHENRISIVSQPKPGTSYVPLQLDSAYVAGDADTLSIFRVAPGTSWRDFKEACKQQRAEKFAIELEGIVSASKSSQLSVGPLSLFKRSDGGVYVPVISRREYVDGQLIRLHLILISVPSETYRTFYYNELQTGPMPSTWRDLLVVFDMARYLRWSVLEPCRESIRRSPGPHLSVEDRAACGDMLKSIEQMSLEAGTWNFKGLDRLASLFPVPQRDWIAAAVQRWAVAVVQLKRAIEASVKTKALRAIEELLLVNGQFLVFAARQFASSLQPYNTPFTAWRLTTSKRKLAAPKTNAAVPKRSTRGGSART